MPDNGWVSVETRLPDDRDKYLVINRATEEYGIARRVDDYWFGDLPHNNITHWAELLPPPTKD